MTVNATGNETVNALSTNWYVSFTIVLSVLSLINGLMLLRTYLRDKPILKVDPVHPEVYQWFFFLPDGKFNDTPTRKYGFLTYIGVRNKGLRDVALCEWHLIIKTRAHKSAELKPINITEPQTQLGGGNMKTWPVLGQKGIVFEGNTMVHSGDSISGFAYYVAEFYGADGWNPIIKDGKTSGRIRIRDAFGKTASANISFSQITPEKACELVPNIHKIC